MLDLYQQRVSQLVPRLQPPHIPAFCAALPAASRGVLGGAAYAAPPPPPSQPNGTSVHPHSAGGATEEVPGGLRQRPARTLQAAAPAAALDQAGLEAVHRQQNLQARSPYFVGVSSLEGSCEVAEVWTAAILDLFGSCQTPSMRAQCLQHAWVMDAVENS